MLALSLSLRRKASATGRALRRSLFCIADKRKNREKSEVRTSAIGKAHQTSVAASLESVNSQTAGKTNTASLRAEMTRGMSA